MPVLVDTRTVSLRERFDFWASSSCRLFHPVELEPRLARPFSGMLLGSDVGQLHAFRLIADACRAARTPRGISAFDPEGLLVAVQARGSCVVTQGGRVAHLRTGDIVSYESSHPYTVESDGPFEIVIFTIPRPLLGADADRLYGNTATRVAGGTPIARLAGPFLHQLASGLDDDGPAGDTHVAEAVVDLVRALYAGADPAPSTRAAERRSPIMRRVMSFVEARLDDPELTPARIAAANAISERYLYKLFAAEDRSLRTWIRDERLERCRRDLADPRRRAEAISELARRRGWKSPAHFSRCFHEAYGCPPRDYRAVALARAQRIYT